MSRIMQARVALAAIGILIWGYAYTQDDANLRLVGIILLAISLALRFARRQRGPVDPPPGD